ncbi:MAG TPA: twin-arginine translocase subunit TatC [Armatimonadota bacterium]|nr:twin-arginine translocase subunit TatC [Armatimonadota bacterium]
MVDVVSREVDKESSEKQLELVDHLAELRNRIIRCIVYVGLGMVVGWVFYGSFFKLLSAPVMRFLERSGSSFLLTGVAEGFTIKVQISLLVGIIIALPLITMEGWGFIAPGLTKSERRAVKLVMPLSILLFVSGVVLGYFVMPAGIKWLISQNPPSAKFMPQVASTLLFILKMYLAFGLVFQMPVVLMFLAKAGLISSRTLKSYWRQAVVALFIIAAAVTPSGDAFTMMMLCVPMVVLYVLSIGLVKLVERSR